MGKEFQSPGDAMPSDVSEATDASLHRVTSLASIGSLHHVQGTSPPLVELLPEPLAPHRLSLSQQAWASAMELATNPSCPSDTADSLLLLVKWGYKSVLLKTRQEGCSLLERAAISATISECFDGVEAVCAVLPELAFEVMHKGCHTLTPDQLETVQRVLDEMEFTMPHE